METALSHWPIVLSDKAVIRAGRHLYRGEPGAACLTTAEIQRRISTLTNDHRRRLASDQFPNTAPPAVGIQYGGGGLGQGVGLNYRDPQSTSGITYGRAAIDGNDTLRVSYVGMHSLPVGYYGGFEPDSGEARRPIKRRMVAVAIRVRRTTTGSRSAAPSMRARQLRSDGGGSKHRMSHGLYFDAVTRWRRTWLTTKEHADGVCELNELRFRLPIDSTSPAITATLKERGIASFWPVSVAVRDRDTFLNQGLEESSSADGMNCVTLLESGPWLTPSISTSFVNEYECCESWRDVRKRRVEQLLKGHREHNISIWLLFARSRGRASNAGVGVLGGRARGRLTGLARVPLNSG